MPVLRLATEVGLVNLHDARQLLKLVILHRGADAVAHVPRGTVGLHPDVPLNLESTDALLALAHQENDGEPRAEREVSVFEDGTDERSEVVAGLRRALLAAPSPGAAELEDALVSTAGAANSIGPPHFHEISAARVFRREPVVQLREGHHA